MSYSLWGYKESETIVTTLNSQVRMLLLLVRSKVIALTTPGRSPGKRGQCARGRGWWEQSGSRASSVLSQFWHKEFLFGWNLGWEK